jgi:RNA polymerase sigma-70 factor (ECF subfamily)
MSEHEDLRPLLFSIAYRMLASVAEAEDLVQETFVRYQQAGAEAVAESPKSYLASITTRLAIDHLRSARVRRETYPGQWLPEPIVEQTPADLAETADSLSMAFLVLLEQLSPVERAVFLLREVFGYAFDEIARAVGRSEVNCRQILVRARTHVSERRPRFESSREKREELARRFFAACHDGDHDALLGLLSADATIYGDGGGKVQASPVPIVGRERAARALITFTRQAMSMSLSFAPAWVNGQPGAVFHDGDGRTAWVVSLDVVDGAIAAVRSVLNPDKLVHVQ